MRVRRLILAFAAGACLYYAAAMFVGGILAAVAAPRGYFEWFGRSRAELALALLDFFGFALPVAGLVAAVILALGCWLSADGCRPLKALLLGMIACFCFWLVVGLLVVPTDFPLAVRLQQMLVPPWWAISSFAAPWAGYALAAWWIRRGRSPLK